MKVMVVGSGGREYSIGLALKRDLFLATIKYENRSFDDNE
jgi:phosphoribosylamine-glycine ligase